MNIEEMTDDEIKAFMKSRRNKKVIPYVEESILIINDLILQAKHLLAVDYEKLLDNPSWQRYTRAEAVYNSLKDYRKDLNEALEILTEPKPEENDRDEIGSS